MNELNAYNLSWETEGLHDNDELKMEKLFVFHIQTYTEFFIPNNIIKTIHVHTDLRNTTFTLQTKNALQFEQL